MDYKPPGRLADAVGALPLPEQGADEIPAWGVGHGGVAPAPFEAPGTGWVDHEWEQAGLLRRFHGVVSLAQIGQSDSEVQASPRFDEIRYLIDDFLGCTNVVDINLSLVDELAAIASVAVRHPEFFRHAVVSSLPAVEELAQEFAQSGFGAYPVRHFDQMALARQWAMA